VKIVPTLTGEHSPTPSSVTHLVIVLELFRVLSNGQNMTAKLFTFLWLHSDFE